MKTDMGETLTGYLVDPNTATISAISLERDENGTILTALYKHIGCQLVEKHELSDNHDLWIDEEGWLISQRAVIGTEAHGTNLLLAGRGVILGVNEDGDCVAPTLAIEDCAASLVAHQAVILADFETKTYVNAGVTVVQTNAAHRAHLEIVPFVVTA